MRTCIQESCPVVFKHLRVSLAACVINFHLEHSLYIDINKNIISYFITVKMLFVILLPIFCKKMKHPPFRIHFDKWIEDKWWLAEGLGRCDRQTLIARGVNLGWLRRSLCNRRVIVSYELKSSQCHFEMSKSITPT